MQFMKNLLKILKCAGKLEFFMTVWTEINLEDIGSWKKNMKLTPIYFLDINRTLIKQFSK